MKNINTALLLCVSSAIICIQSVSQSAITVVQFGPSPDYIATTTANFGRANDPGGGILFDLSTPLSPTTFGSPEGLNSTFYGGYEPRFNGILGGVGMEPANVTGSADGDYIRFRTRTSSVESEPGPKKVSVAIMFVKEDFLGTASDYPVSFNSQSTFSTYIRFNQFTANHNTEYGLIVEQGGQIFRSNLLSLSSPQSAMGAPIEISGLVWYEYDPFAGIDITGPGVLVTPVFDDITGLGIYAHGHASADAGRAEIGLAGFQVVAVPEPSTYAALLGLGALIFAGLRRRKTAK